MLLSERFLRERLAGKITNGTAIHLIGHSAGGFVAGECAKRLSKAGFSNLQVTMLDTPIPYKSHVGSGWRTERHISSVAGGRFESEPGTSTFVAKFYNLGARLKGDMIESITWQTSTAESSFANSQSTAAFILIDYDAVASSGVSLGSLYRRLEIPNPVIRNGSSVYLPGGVKNRHGFARDWYEWTVRGEVASDGFAFSNLLSSTPFPQSIQQIQVPPADPDGPIILSDPPAPEPVDGFTYFGMASGAGGVHTFTENTDAGMWKEFTLPIGSQTLRFRYQFTTPGDGDFLAAYWGEEAVLVICPDTDSARTGFVEMEADVSRFGGQQGNLVFKLVSRGEVNAVAQIDQVQIVLSDDPDDDGLTNTQEASYGSNPHRDDTDGDGLSDYDEVTTHGTDPIKADSDGDMVPDAAELAASTNPLNRNSYLRPCMERGTSGQPELRWQGVSGRTYSVVRSLDLSGTAFDFIRTEVPGAGVDCSVSDPDTSVNPRAFYWVVPE
jgi:pimeloyl-ACP methyl ester carboxylesterase